MLVTVASALVVATCSAGRDRAAPPAAPSSPSAPSPLDALVEAAVASASSQAPPLATEIADAPTALPAPSASAPAARVPGRELDRFYAALRGLEQRTRKEHVRVMWLGDSHGAADLWSGPLREALQARFGAGGPGFVHLGYKSTRHEQIKQEIKGKWVTSPRGPSTSVPTGDGVFGLSGVLLAGSADGPRASITVTAKNLPSALLWDLCWKPTAAQDELTVSLTGQPDRTLKADPAGALGALRHVAMTSTGPSPTLRVLPLGGQPKLCGAVVETDPKTQPGVVLDNLGINGARLTTPLAWDEASWVAELGRRPPTLVILEYGTNESGDFVIDPRRYLDHLQRLLARVRRASPACDCLVLAPTDRADTQDKSPLVRDALRDAAKASGCMFWDTYAVMGGKGSILAWRSDHPPRAAADGVHLHPRGYRELGDKLTADLLAGYRP